MHLWLASCPDAARCGGNQTCKLLWGSICHVLSYACFVCDAFAYFCMESLTKHTARSKRFEMQIIASTAKAHGCSAEIDWMEEAHPYYPPTINNPDLAAFVKGVGAR